MESQRSSEGKGHRTPQIEVEAQEKEAPERKGDLLHFPKTALLESWFSLPPSDQAVHRSPALASGSDVILGSFPADRDVRMIDPTDGMPGRRPGARLYTWRIRRRRSKRGPAGSLTDRRSLVETVKYDVRPTRRVE